MVDNNVAGFISCWLVKKNPRYIHRAPRIIQPTAPSFRGSAARKNVCIFLNDSYEIGHGIF